MGEVGGVDRSPQQVRHEGDLQTVRRRWRWKARHLRDLPRLPRDRHAQARRHQDGNGSRHVQVVRHQRRWCHQHGGARQGPEAQDAPQDRGAPRSGLGLRQGEVGRVGRTPQQVRHEIFKQFDADGDGKLDIYEISRAFRAIGMPKRDGTKMEMDHATFKSFDTNGDGVISMEELDKGLKPKTRRKIEVLLEAGWAFDKEKWVASVARHNKYDMRSSNSSTPMAMESSTFTRSPA